MTPSEWREEAALWRQRAAAIDPSNLLLAIEVSDYLRRAEFFEVVAAQMEADELRYWVRTFDMTEASMDCL